MGFSLEYGRDLGTRVAIAAFIWWVLSEGRSDSWFVGAVTIAIAVAASLWVAPTRGGPRPRALALLAFTGFFLAQSLRAGFEVARLALLPNARIAPHGVDISLTLPPGPPRYLLAGTLSLLPGTLSVRLDEERLLVHALAGRGRTRADVRALEARIARLFGITA